MLKSLSGSFLLTCADSVFALSAARVVSNTHDQFLNDPKNMDVPADVGGLFSVWQPKLSALSLFSLIHEEHL